MENKTKAGYNTGSAMVANNEAEIDLVALAQALVSKWYKILLFVLLGALIANAYAFFGVKPTYESTAKLYIVSSSGDSAIDLTDLNIGTNLTNDYQELILSYPVLDQVISELSLNMTADDLKNIVTLSNPSNTRVLSIIASTNDPELSADIANTVAGVAQEYLPETMSTPRPNIAQVARVAEQKSSPSFSKYTVMGALIGILLMAGWLTFLYIMDDTVHSAEDLKKAFDITTLAEIPENKQMRQHDETPNKESKRSLLKKIIRR